MHECTFSPRIEAQELSMKTRQKHTEYIIIMFRH